MSKQNASSADHLEWLVRCRCQNQQSSLVLFKMFEQNLELIKKDGKLSSAAVPLTAICFSLWRAVFLADRVDGHENRVGDAFSFLKALISDNSITYAQDKNSREWTFYYYVNNARFRLKGLSDQRPEVLPNFNVPPGLESLKLWEHCQKTLDLAIGNLSNLLQRA
jgi:hypothetical protein